MMVIGARFYPSDEGGSARQARARAAILALRDVVPVNLQFTDETFAPEGFRTLPVLERDARIVTGASGARMPVVSEMLDRLADVACEHGSRYFMFLNADIQVTADAVAWIVENGRDAYAFSRADIDPASGTFAGMMILGIDAVAFDLSWWTRHRHRFRPYVSGPCWDNVYASIMCTHGNGQIISDRRLVYHEQHPSTWRPEGPYAEYNGFLAALDAPYFSRWVDYINRLQDAAAAGRPVDCDAVAREVFSGPLLTPAGYARHVARRVRAHLRYACQRRTSS
jgi:hypothetical protein